MLNYTIILNDGDWQIWLPDMDGTCIGVGSSVIRAKEDAIRNMEALCSEFYGHTSPKKVVDTLPPFDNAPFTHNG